MNPQLEAHNKAKIGDYVIPIDEAVDPNAKEKDAYPTGVDFLDGAMAKNNKAGLKDGDLMIISGKSGHGKTLFALNMIKNFMDEGIPSILFSYEVVIDNVYDTLVEMGVTEKPIIYTPKKNITGDIEWIKAKVREADKKYGAKVVVIDHLDFLTAKGITNDDYRRNEIHNIITELKNFAIEEKKVIILIAHIVKTRERKPQNEDIADSRATNNIPDYIMFVGRQVNSEGIAEGNTGIFKLTKNRYTGKHIAVKFEVSNSLIISYELYTD